jgi:hypothetical protein
MEIKDQTISTATGQNGTDYISEITATVTEIRADGTEITAEITTTANPDNPTEIEGQMTITEVAPDGTETVTQLVANKDGIFIVEEQSPLAEFVSAVLGIELADNLTPIDVGSPVPFDDDSADVYQAEPDYSITLEDITIPEELLEQDSMPSVESEMQMPEEIETPFVTEPFDTDFQNPEPILTENPADETPFAANSETQSNEISEEEAAQLAEQEANALAAAEAQQAADEFVEKGDYAAAAEARAVAEEAAGQAGDYSMLGVYDAQDLEFAASKQEDAAYYQQQQAEHLKEGNYEAAREDALNAGYATSDADSIAGGADHTGQSDKDVANLDNAVWQEKIADSQMGDAAYYAEAGNAEAAENAYIAAFDSQQKADDFAERAEPGNIMRDYDHSSEVETGGSFESTYDADITGFDPNMNSGFDATAGMDTSYDAGADLAVDTGFDTGVDTTVDTSFDSGTSDV